MGKPARALIVQNITALFVFHSSLFFVFAYLSHIKTKKEKCFIFLWTAPIFFVEGISYALYVMQERSTTFLLHHLIRLL